LKNKAADSLTGKYNIRMAIIITLFLSNKEFQLKIQKHLSLKLNGQTIIILQQAVQKGFKKISKEKIFIHIQNIIQKIVLMLKAIKSPTKPTIYTKRTKQKNLNKRT